MPNKRRILYPALQGPVPLTLGAAPETVTVDKWFSPLATPTLRAAARVPTATLPPAQTAGNPTVDKWLQPLSIPARRPPPNVAIASPSLISAQFPETVSVDRWFSPLSQPVRRAVMRGQLTAVLPPPQFTVVETVTVDKWFSPLAVPTLRGRPNVGIIGATPFIRPPTPNLGTGADTIGGFISAGAGKDAHGGIGADTIGPFVSASTGSAKNTITSAGADTIGPFVCATVGSVTTPVRSKTSYFLIERVT